MDIEKRVAVVGLGYVGLPLALAFGRKMHTLGFDINVARIASCSLAKDSNGESAEADFTRAEKLYFSTDPSEIRNADFVIVAVPTPIDNARRPDLSPLRSACEVVGKNLKLGAIVIFESTVYPGVTEDFCVPVLEKYSGLKCGKEFRVGYSPERINPGDKNHTLESIIKVVSAQDQDSLEMVAQLYSMVVHAGVYRAKSIKVAEAAKVIENTQRDLNIALMNELSLIFHKIGLDTIDVLSAAETKWNFLPFRPGLVGGHCIGVDPYYLTHKAEMLGYHPQIILAGRRINDSMGPYIAQSCVKELIAANRSVKGAKVLILGLTFKENVPDIRNSKVIDIYKELQTFGINPLVWDPIANEHEVNSEFGIKLCNLEEITVELDAIILAVKHDAAIAIDFERLTKNFARGMPFLDVKSAFSPDILERHGFRVWRL